MTREELLAEALDCAKAAKAAAHTYQGEKASQAWSRAGMLFTVIASMTPVEPRPPVDRPA